MSAQKTMQERDMQKVTSKQKVVSFFVQFFLYVFLILMALIIIFPFYWMLISSVKSLEEYKLAVPTLFPRQIFLLENRVSLLLVHFHPNATIDYIILLPSCLKFRCKDTIFI